jgi:hypothetical protein
VKSVLKFFASEIRNETLVDHLLRSPTTKIPFLKLRKLATYRALKKKRSQVNIGSTGKKNCLVTGTNNASISNDAAPVLTNGPGAWLMESENMQSMINIKYCPS